MFGWGKRASVVLAAVALAGSSSFLVSLSRQVALAAGDRVVSAQTPESTDPADTGPLVAEGEAADLVILYTGAVVGYVDPCG